MINLADATEVVFWLADITIRVAVLLLVAWILTLTLRKVSAAWRHLVWVLAALGALALPFLSPLLPRLFVSFLPVVAPSGSVPVISSPHMTLPGWPLWVLFVWGIGVILVLLRWVIGYSYLTQYWRQSTIVEDPAWIKLLVDTSRRLELQRPVSLRMSTQITIAITWGVLHPVILLPVGAVSWDKERRAMVLLHELAHVKRLDWLTHLPVQCACALYWFNPLTWVAAHAMQTERECACDDLVLRAGYQASDYAGHLLALVREGRDSAFAAGFAVTRSSNFEVRLRALLAATRCRNVVSQRAALVTILLLCAVLAPLMMLQGKSADRAQPVATTATAGEFIPAAPANTGNVLTTPTYPTNRKAHSSTRSALVSVKHRPVTTHTVTTRIPTVAAVGPVRVEQPLTSDPSVTPRQEEIVAGPQVLSMPEHQPSDGPGPQSGNPQQIRLQAVTAQQAINP